VPVQAALVPGAESIPERRGFLPAIAHDRSYDKNDSKEQGKDANQDLAIDEVEHCGLPCIEYPSPPEGGAAVAAANWKECEAG
jgi:hypothetical protein